MVSIIDVISDVTGKDCRYAAKVFRRLLNEERIPQCEMRLLPPRDSLKEANCPLQRMGRGGSRDQPTPVATAPQMVGVIWQLPGTAEFRRNCAQLVVRYLGGDEGLVEEIRANRQAQEQLATSNPSHPARLFGEAVEAHQRAEPPEERAQKLRRMCLENDELEMRNVSAARLALVDAGLQLDDAQRWCFRDRMSNLMRGDGVVAQQQSTHAGLFLTTVKGMPASQAKLHRSSFGRLAAEIKRRKDNLAPGTELPKALKNVGGNPTMVAIYRVPEELGVLEEAYKRLLQTSAYQAADAPSQRSEGQRRLEFNRG